MSSSNNAPNELPWPSIVQLPRSLCEKIDEIIKQFEKQKYTNRPANITIVTKTDNDDDDDTTDAPIIAISNNDTMDLGAALSSLLEIRVDAVEKIDGTNLGIDSSNGQLFGRRREVSKSSMTYQKTNVEMMKHIDIDGFKQAIKGLAADNAALRDSLQSVRLYGELGCNAKLYDYEEKGFAGTWQCFGALVVVAPIMRSSWVSTLIDNSFKVGYSHKHASATDNDSNAGVIKLTSSTAFFNVLDSLSIPHPPILSSGTLAEVIERHKEWMMSNQGEGFVLTLSQHVVNHTDNDDDGRKSEHLVSLRKWKQGHEPQQKDIKELQRVLDKHDHILPDDVKHLLQTLLEIAQNGNGNISGKVNGQRQANNEAKQSKKKKVRTELDVEIEEAIKSAASKYDDPSTFFERDGDDDNAGRDEYIELLLKEVSVDITDIIAASDAGDSAVLAEKVTNEVKRYVGRCFAEWKKSSSSGHSHITHNN